MPSQTKMHIFDVLEQSKRKDSPSVKAFIREFHPELLSMPHSLAVTCLMENRSTVPKCFYFSNDDVIRHHNGRFANCCAKVWGIVKHDSHINVKWLTWEHLLRVGLTFDDAKKLKQKKHFLFATEFFSGANDIMGIQQAMMNDTFTVEKIVSLTENLDLNNFESIDLFIGEIRKIKSNKNCTIEYFTQRGYPLIQAKLLLKDFFQKGPNATRRKMDTDSEYAAWFRKTRLPGLIAQNRGSKMEQDIRDEFNRRGIKIAPLTTHIISGSQLNQQHDRSWFCHDFYLPELKIIAEYNGKYWHQDKVFEIEKAAYVVGATGCKYISLWEGSFPTATEYVDFILSASGNPRHFLSTDPEEYVKFLEFLNSKEALGIQDSAFLDVADRLALLSKCQSRKVCALAVKDGRIIGTGLNGTMAGGLNCCDVFPDGVNQDNRLQHREWSKFNEIHAEESLIADAASTGRGLKGCTVYVSLQPCQKCSLYLTRIGAVRIVYRNDYDFGNTEFSRRIFKHAKILFSKLDAKVT